MTIGNEGIDGPPFNPANVNITGGTISGATITENLTTSTDPAANAAVTTAIVNSYNGVVVTLTTAGNTQTIQNPTTAATIRKFMVVNNDTSTHNLPVVANSVTFTLTPGEGQCFIWDGSAWGPTDLGITSLPVPVTQGGTGLATITDHGIMLGSGAGAVTPLGVATDGQIPIGSSGADPVLAAITPGDGIDVTNAAGSITVAVDLKANGGLVIDTTELTVDLSASAITGTLAVADGGTGASTAQAAINALSAVSAATNEYVLTKDTATGNAIFKANVGGIPVAAAAGTVDAITADYTPDVTLADQKMVAVVAAGANTSTTPTFAPDGLTARTIVKNGGQALAAGDISGAGHVIILEYNLANTRWELLNPKVNIDLTAPGPIGGTTPSTGAFTGLTLSDAGKITIDIAPASDHTATGIQFSATAGEALAYGNVCYLKSDGKYWKIDANAAATMPATVMALATIAGDAAGNFLDYGWARDDSWSWTIGGMVYASTDSGGLTQTAPSGEADNIQIVGKAETATVLKFAPSWITANMTVEQELTVSGDYGTTLESYGQANTLALNESLTIGTGYSGTIRFTAPGKTLSINENTTLNGTPSPGGGGDFLVVQVFS